MIPGGSVTIRAISAPVLRNVADGIFPNGSTFQRGPQLSCQGLASGESIDYIT